ncbi:hypothetical protein GCM10007939_14340 [Amylibacter marinus]|uniref:Thioesterase domain-containing protein n=1 Tax=Amylibacter marinus TaxID=1475483 RepID=A0ABQ5VVB6_9RHOB|nr:PaaI family thioesterase [Amylibacter marinus]GLQ35151.1 hypothetical protein GCM10007939_14340 [Amylibacter marinus]
MSQHLTIPQIQQIKDEVCADWINRLQINMQSFDTGGALFHWVATPELLRNIHGSELLMSGQAMMAVADTASFMTICAVNGRMRHCVTVDMHTNFLRPMQDGTIEVTIQIIANGRKTVTTRTDFRMQGKERICATATGVFMYLDS